MKARISDELENAIQEKIMLDLEVHVLERKLNKGAPVEDLLVDRRARLKEYNAILRKEQVKVLPPVRRNEIFIDYSFSQKVDGGFKEGVMSFWDIVLKQRTQKRLNQP